MARSLVLGTAQVARNWPKRGANHAPEETPIVADLPVRFYLRWVDGSDEYVDVSIRTDAHGRPCVYVNSGRPLEVRPCASNAIEIGLEDYGRRERATGARKGKEG